MHLPSFYFDNLHYKQEDLPELFGIDQEEL